MSVWTSFTAQLMPVYFAAPVSSDDVGGFHLGGYDAG